MLDINFVFNYKINCYHGGEYHEKDTIDSNINHIINSCGSL
jgi:hypothetical protein